MALALALATAVASGPVAAQKLYKWVDENGNVFYSDQVPPEQVKRGREELNEQGVVVSTVDRAKTPEEVAAAAEQLRAEQARQEAEEKRLREERKLLAQYASEQDIISMRDQRLDAVSSRINLAQSLIDSHSTYLAGLTKRASELESQGLDISAELHDSIEELQSQIAHQEQKIVQWEADKVALRKEFEDELVKFRAVKQRRSDAP
ncbi:MAG: DUF4124 domain-containing protein [Pseudomonadota bacterium]